VRKDVPSDAPGNQRACAGERNLQVILKVIRQLTQV